MPKDKRQFAKTRSYLLNQAATVYAREGFGSVSARALSKHLKVSKGLIYHYFSSTDEILFELMDRLLDGLIESVATISSARLKQRERLNKLSLALMSHCTSSNVHYQIFCRDRHYLSNVHASKIDEKHERFMTLLRANIALPKDTNSSFHRNAPGLLILAVNLVHALIDSRQDEALAAGIKTASSIYMATLLKASRASRC